jgi:hypothetical protein
MKKETVQSAILADIHGFYRRFVPDIKPNGKDLLATCPFHPDQNPSLKINPEDGRYHCFSCGAGGDTFTFFGRLKGLDPKTDFSRILEEVGELLGVHDESLERSGKVVATFIYRDKDGTPVYWKDRIEPGHNGRKKGFFFYCIKDGKKVTGRGGEPLPYNLPALADGPVYFVEGEAKADLLAGWGLAATSLDTGSTVPAPAALQKWQEHFHKHFQGKTSVCILPDNDDPGHKYADFLAGELKPIVGSVKVVTLPGLPPKGDIIDWAKAGGTKEKFMELVSQAREWTPDVRLSFLKSWDEIYHSVIEVEYLVDRLLPKNAITVLFGRGGIGKTWLTLDMARCIGEGVPFLGLDTKQTPVVYVDFENPLAVLTARTQKLGEAEGVFFWLANDETQKAPKLDSPEWEIYKTLPKGAVVIFDTLRASQSKDEDKSQDMANILGRLKELRDIGFTVILLHHTAKNNDRVAKGSTAIVDMADHILGLTLVKKKADGKDVVVNDDDEDQEEAVYRFGWREKTRFEPFHLYLILNPDRGFEPAPDPQDRTLELMAEILEDLGPCSKGDFYEACKKLLNLGQKKVRRLLNQGAGRLWDMDKAPGKNLYTITPKKSKSATGSADLKNASNSNTAFEKADLSPENQGQPTDFTKNGNPEESVCRFAELDPFEGVI